MKAAILDYSYMRKPCNYISCIINLHDTDKDYWGYD